MKLARKLLLVALVLVGCLATSAQRISFTSDRLSENDPFGCRLAAPLDTVKHTSGRITVVSFVNTQDHRQYEEITEADTLGWGPDIPLTSSIQVGDQALFVRFPDGFTRAFQQLVHSSVKKDVQNNRERIILPMVVNDLQTLVSQLEAQMDTADSAAVMGPILAGTKALLCLDFASSRGFGNARDSIDCIAGQYLFQSTAGNVNAVASLTTLFRTFLGVSKPSPLYALLSGGWLMGPDQFDPLHPPGEEIIGDANRYKFFLHKNEAVNQRIKVGYYKGDHLRRILIFINNSG
jgi:hypothetical protein